jgi:hypothetical protein
MGRSTPAGVDDFRDGVGGRSDFLKVDGQDSKEKDLDGGTRRVPAGSMVRSVVCVLEV